MVVNSHGVEFCTRWFLLRNWEELKLLLGWQWKAASYCRFLNRSKPSLSSPQPFHLQAPPGLPAPLCTGPLPHVQAGPHPTFWLFLHGLPWCSSGRLFGAPSLGQGNWQCCCLLRLPHNLGLRMRSQKDWNPNTCSLSGLHCQGGTGRPCSLVVLWKVLSHLFKSGAGRNNWPLYAAGWENNLFRFTRHPVLTCFPPKTWRKHSKP